MIPGWGSDDGQGGGAVAKLWQARSAASKRRSDTWLGERRDTVLGKLHYGMGCYVRIRA